MNNRNGIGHPTRRIGVAVESRYTGQAQPRGVLDALARMIHVELIDVAGSDQLDECDVVLARGRSESLLRLLAEAEYRGLRTVNRSSAVRGVLDKVEMHHRLLNAGVRVPRTWTGPIGDLRRQLRVHGGPLVIKPVLGDNCRDVSVLEDGRALQEVPWAEPTAIVQEYIANDGFDTKLYGIGDRVWTVRKPSPLHASTVPAARLTTSLDDVRLGRRCANAFGLDLYGVDCITTRAGLVVIEVNDFPNYSGIDGAADLLAEFVVSQIDERVEVMAS
jgi:ribosomal protein S6--L-glutamate ligase